MQSYISRGLRTVGAAALATAVAANVFGQQRSDTFRTNKMAGSYKNGFTVCEVPSSYHEGDHNSIVVECKTKGPGMNYESVRMGDGLIMLNYPGGSHPERPYLTIVVPPKALSLNEMMERYGQSIVLQPSNPDGDVIKILHEDTERRVVKDANKTP